MWIGIDFDNTLVNYDRAFFEVARSEDLIPTDFVATKTAVRDHLRATGREADWTRLQGVVYGTRMDLAHPFAGALDFLLQCREADVPVSIISHKTQVPYRGPAYDLHASAIGWLQQHGVLEPGRIGLPRDRVFFEPTKESKLARIAALGCTHFIDDLPEFLAEPDFPAGVDRLLLDCHDHHPGETRFERFRSWSELRTFILPTKAQP